MNTKAVAIRPSALLLVLLVQLVLFPTAQLARAATRDLERVRIGYSVGGLIPFPLIVAKENRFFEQAGFDAELINIPPTIAVTALVSGDIQYVIFAGTTLNAAVRGLPVKLVMVYNDRPLFSLMSLPADIHAERLGLRRLAFMGDTLESINGGFGVSERWLQQRPDQIKKMIAVAFRGMAHARAQRQDSIVLIMSKWKLEREIADKVFEMMIKTWTDSGIASEQALQAGIEESLKVSNTKQSVPISRVADFTLAREVYRELKGK